MRSTFRAGTEAFTSQPRPPNLAQHVDPLPPPRASLVPRARPLLGRGRRSGLRRGEGPRSLQSGWRRPGHRHAPRRGRMLCRDGRVGHRGGHRRKHVHVHARVPEGEGWDGRDVHRWGSQTPARADDEGHDGGQSDSPQQRSKRARHLREGRRVSLFLRESWGRRRRDRHGRRRLRRAVNDPLGYR